MVTPNGGEVPKVGATGPAGFGFLGRLSGAFTSCQILRLKSIPRREANKLRNVACTEVATDLLRLSSKRAGGDHTRSKVIYTNTRPPDFIRLLGFLWFTQRPLAEA